MKPACPPACELPGTHLVTFCITQCSPCQPQLVQFLLWEYKQDKKENVSECLVAMKNSIITHFGWFMMVYFQLPSSSTSQPLAHNTTTCLVIPCLTPPKPPPSKEVARKTPQRFTKRRTPHPKKGNLMFAQGIQTYMSTFLCVAWDTLSYILYHTVFSLPATAGPISTVRVQAGQEGKCKWVLGSHEKLHYHPFWMVYDGLLPASFFQHLSAIGPQHYHMLGYPLSHTTQAPPLQRSS